MWELQALLKARPVAGCEAVGRAFLDRVRPLLLAPRPREAVVRSIAALRKSARRAGAADVKNGAGGLRDIEFLVQGLQLIHAPGRPDLLEGNTLKALSGLSRQGLLPEAAARQLEADYVFLRRVEHGLQLLEDLQVHAVPAEPAAREALARRVLGPGASLARFDADLEACRSRVREAYARRLLEAGASD